MFGFGAKKRIYLDHASATPVLKVARDAVYTAMDVYANPGGIHADSVAAKRLLENSRERLAAHLGCKSREVVFTSGLTEANNIGIVGAARALERARRTLADTHWIVSSIEHASVLECFSEVERMGGHVTHVDPEPTGIISTKKIAHALRAETVFVSVGWGNNEIGTIQPLADIARAIHEHEKKHGTIVLLHSDAGQAPLYRVPHVHTLGVDLFALGSGKLYGPRSVGALYVSNRTVLAPVVFGGGQERGLRSGTEDPALAAGFVEAFDVVTRERESEFRRLQNMRDNFAHEVVTHIPGVILNGDLRHTLPHMLNISIPGEKNGEYLALQLDHAGIALSTKSACSEGEKASHVVRALGVGPSHAKWRSENTLRFSFGRGTTEDELTRALDALKHLISA